MLSYEERRNRLCNNTTRKSSFDNVNKKPSPGLNQIIVLGVITFFTLGMYELYRVLGFELVRSPALKVGESACFVLGSCLGGILYNCIGIRVMIFLSSVVYGIDVGILRLAESIGEARRCIGLRIISTVLTGLASSSFWIVAGCAITAYSDPAHRLWFFAFFWALYKLGNCVGSVVQIALVALPQRTLIASLKMIDALGAVMAASAIFGAYLLNEPQFIRRSDHFSRPMGFQGVRRVWTIPKRTPGFLWMTGWFFFCNFGSYYTGLEGFRLLTGHFTALTTPIVVAALTTPLPFRKVLSSIYKAFCITSIDPHPAHKKSKHSTIPTSPRELAGLPNCHINQEIWGMVIAQEEKRKNIKDDAHVAKMENDPNFAKRSRQLLHSYAFLAVITFSFGSCVHWFIPRGHEIESLSSHIYIALRNIMTTVARAYCVWYIGYYSGNSVGLAIYYISYFETLQAIGNGVAWSVYLACDQTFANKLTYGLSLAGASISIICGLKANFILAKDATPPYRVRNGRPVILFDRLNSIRWPLPRQKQKDLDIFLTHLPQQSTGLMSIANKPLKNQTINDCGPTNFIEGSIVAIQGVSELRQALRGHRSSNTSSPMKMTENMATTEPECVVFFPSTTSQIFLSEQYNSCLGNSVPK